MKGKKSFKTMSSLVLPPCSVHKWLTSVQFYIHLRDFNMTQMTKSLVFLPSLFLNLSQTPFSFS